MQHQLPREDEQRNRDQRRGVRAGGRLDDQHVGRQAEIEHRRERRRAQRDCDRHAEREQHREHAEQYRERHSVGHLRRAAARRAFARARTARTARRPPRTATKYRPTGSAAPGVFTAHVSSIKPRPEAGEHDADTRPSRAGRSASSSDAAERPSACTPSAKRKCVSWRTPTAAANINAIFKSSKATGSVQPAGASST